MNRVFHITLHKCGSQWVRDVLSAPEIVACSGYPHSGIVPNFADTNRLDLPDHTFNGPIYRMNQWEWQFYKRLGDKAVVVLRDPRDVLISWMFSMLYSHGSSAQVDLARRLLHALPDEQTRITYLLYETRASHRFYRTWFEARDADALVVRYEDLVANQHAEFTRIVDWLGWSVPKETLEAVVERLSFKARSGRKPGESNKFSHFRRGVAGDWRNHFTREHGELWEQLYPGFIREIGYEESNDWWHSLPDRQLGDASLGANVQGTLTNEENLVAVLEKKLRQAQRELEEKERVIQELLKAKHAAQLPPSMDSPGFVQERSLQQAESELEEKERVIQELLQAKHAAQLPPSMDSPDFVQERRLQQAQRELEEKERVIQELLQAKHAVQQPSSTESSTTGLLARWFRRPRN